MKYICIRECVDLTPFFSVKIRYIPGRMYEFKDPPNKKYFRRVKDTTKTTR